MPPSGEAPLVLFVCRHGAARSVLGAATLDALAGERGIAIRSRAAGVDPQEQMSAALARLLPDGVLGIGDARPRRVTADDVEEARRTVTFDLDPAELPSAATHLERWDGVPALADDPAGAKAEITRRVAALLDDLV